MLVVKGRVDHKQEGETKLIAIEVSAVRGDARAARGARCSVDARARRPGSSASSRRLMQRVPGRDAGLRRADDVARRDDAELGPDYRVEPAPDFFAEVKRSSARPPSPDRLGPARRQAVVARSLSQAGAQRALSLEILTELAQDLRSGPVIVAYRLDGLAGARALLPRHGELRPASPARLRGVQCQTLDMSSIRSDGASEWRITRHVPRVLQLRPRLRLHFRGLPSSPEGNCQAVIRHVIEERQPRRHRPGGREGLVGALVAGRDPREGGQGHASRRQREQYEALARIWRGEEGTGSSSLRLALDEATTVERGDDDIDRRRETLTRGDRGRDRRTR